MRSVITSAVWKQENHRIRNKVTSRMPLYSLSTTHPWSPTRRTPGSLKRRIFSAQAFLWNTFPLTPRNAWPFRAATFASTRIHYITKDRMTYGDARFGSLKRRLYFEKRTTALQEIIMQATLQPVKYGKVDYGG